MNPTWKVYFQFSKKELKGIFALGTILFGSVLLSKLFPAVKNTESKTESRTESITVVKLFEFDPNQIDSLHAIQLGIPEKQVRSLLHYRAKGGYFKNGDDFARLYGLSTDLFKILRPYIKMEQRYKAHEYHNNYTAYNNELSKGKLDINTADEKEWAQKTKIPLPTIKRILSYKLFLGSFSSVSQLSKVYGLPDSTYQLIRRQVYVKNNQQNLMNATAMGFNDWKKLGAFTDRQIWSILRLRKENGGRIGWGDLVEACDLTQTEAQELKLRVRLSD